MFRFKIWHLLSSLIFFSVQYSIYCMRVLKPCIFGCPIMKLAKFSFLGKFCINSCEINDIVLSHDYKCIAINFSHKIPIFCYIEGLIGKFTNICTIWLCASQLFQFLWDGGSTYFILKPCILLQKDMVSIPNLKINWFDIS